MRAFSELLGRIALWSGLLWVGAILVVPPDLRPALVCRPVVWLTGSLADVASAAAGADRAGFDHTEALGNFSRACMRVMSRYFDPGTPPA
jgi:hypothetical protein